MHTKKFSRSGSCRVAAGPQYSRQSGFFSLASTRKTLSRGAMLADIFLVVLWGATIPGLMWLGAAGGF